MEVAAIGVMFSGGFSRIMSLISSACLSCVVSLACIIFYSLSCRYRHQAPCPPNASLVRKLDEQHPMIILHGANAGLNAAKQVREVLRPFGLLEGPELQADASGPEIDLPFVKLNVRAPVLHSATS